MNFTSPLFLAGFPVVCLLYRALGSGACSRSSLLSRRNLLLAASWLFYMGGSLPCFPLLVLVTLVTWFGGLRIERSSDPAARKGILTAVLVSVLAVLFTFKYLGFVEDSILSLAGISRRGSALPLPAGISFYTFQSLSYCIDVYRGDLKAERSFPGFALFVSFFPQLVAGPIERAGSLMPQLRACPSPTDADTVTGAFLVLRGFFKKIVIADFLSSYVDVLFGAEAGQGISAAGPACSGPATLLAGILFGLQIYADFSGYSDIALGAARLVGIRLSVNFDSPYLAGSIREFWRRWHITLTRWFTDYVYIPLGGSRRGTAMQVRNILVVFLLSGFWHGAGWHFAAWGLYHGLLLSCGVLWRRARRSRSKDAVGYPADGSSPSGTFSALRPLRIALTFLLTSLGWILFRASTLKQALAMYAALATGWDRPADSLRSAFAASGLSVSGASLLRLLLIPLLLYLLRKLPVESSQRFAAAGRTLLRMTAFLMAAVIGIAWLGSLAGGTNNAFIYFRF